MDTQCTEIQLEMQGLGRRKVHLDFNGGHVSSDGGALLLRAVDDRLKLTERFAACFTDYRQPRLVEHSVLELVRQRTYGIDLAYEDLNDHDDLLRDPLLALLSGKRDVEGQNRRRASDKGKALASSSTLNRLELTPENADAQSRYKKVVYSDVAIENFFVDVFLDSFEQAPTEIILDFDATDGPLHGHQEGRFFNGYYDSYCYMPLYVTCGEHLLVSQLRPGNQGAATGSLAVLQKLVARIRKRWPDVRILFRADAGFMGDAIMTWCEANRVKYVIGLSRNERLLKRIRIQRYEAWRLYEQTGTASRVFTEFKYRTRTSWTRVRRVIAKAEHLCKGPNPRFIVTNLSGSEVHSRELYEEVYCARGDMENRIKEQQLDLFADRTSTHTLRANQLRLWFSSLAYVLTSALRRIALKGTRLATATSGTIRLKLFKIGALIKLSVRRFQIHLASACPYQDVFHQALNNLYRYPLRN
jgi:hypothetical protein